MTSSTRNSADSPLLCPRCKEALRETKVHGIAVDFCVRCEGLWLDKGELEALNLKSGSLLNFFRNLLSSKPDGP